MKRAVKVKDVAREIRQRAATGSNEAEFARLCIEFDGWLPVPQPEDDLPILDPQGDPRLAYVLALVANRTLLDDQTLQIALVWLDGKGYGELELKWPDEELKRIG